MRPNLFRVGSSIALVLTASSAIPLSAQTEEPVPNWVTPAYWTPPAVREAGGHDALAPMAAEPRSGPLPFIPINPCRLVDTRQAGFPAGYGPPALAGGVPRDFDLNSDPLCPGLPLEVEAYSLNITVTNTQGPGFILIYPKGGDQPTVSTLNYLAGQTVANAAIVPANNTGSVTVVAGVSGTDLIIDINGYYAWASAGSLNTFLGDVAGFRVTTGSQNVGIGWEALASNTTGSFNTALGARSLIFNTEGSSNTALGDSALSLNETGHNNTAIGAEALLVTTPSSNTAVGYRALRNSTGGVNIALGANAGVNLQAGGFNMYLGNEGVANESATIRIGSGLQHARLFLAGVLGTNIGSGNAMYINSLGQVGTVVSSARYKEDVRDMGDASDRLFELRPVTFRYKGHAGDPVQFGLLAEDVERVLPELVFRNPAGEPQSVMYHELPAMLVNELQKQRKRIATQQEEIADLLVRLAVLEARLADTPTK